MAPGGCARAAWPLVRAGNGIALRRRRGRVGRMPAGRFAESAFPQGNPLATGAGPRPRRGPLAGGAGNGHPGAGDRGFPRRVFGVGQQCLAGPSRGAARAGSARAGEGRRGHPLAQRRARRARRGRRGVPAGNRRARRCATGGHRGRRPRHRGKDADLPRDAATDSAGGAVPERARRAGQVAPGGRGGGILRAGRRRGPRASCWPPKANAGASSTGATPATGIRKSCFP